MKELTESDKNLIIQLRSYFKFLEDEFKKNNWNEMEIMFQVSNELINTLEKTLSCNYLYSIASILVYLITTIQFGPIELKKLDDNIYNYFMTKSELERKFLNPSYTKTLKNENIKNEEAEILLNLLDEHGKRLTMKDLEG